MDNTYVNGSVNESEELDNNKVVEQIQETTETLTDLTSDVEENEYISDEVEQEETIIKEANQENACDEGKTEPCSENGKKIHKPKKVSGKKIAIVAGVGVALVGAVLLIHRNTAKTAYFVARSIM